MQSNHIEVNKNKRILTKKISKEMYKLTLNSSVNVENTSSYTFFVTYDTDVWTLQ